MTQPESGDKLISTITALVRPPQSAKLQTQQPKNLVVDIETVSSWDTIPTSIRANLEAKGQTEDTAALSPFLGKIAVISVLDPDSLLGRTLYVAGTTVESPDTSQTEDGMMRFEPYKSEDELLFEFWSIFHRNKRVRIIGYNFRGFDGPFIMNRSFCRNIPVGRNLVPYRYSTEEVLDLMDVLSHYGACKAGSLEAVCAGSGITSPKSTMSGKDVGTFWNQGLRLQVARYCAEDVKATAKLYRRWVDTTEHVFTSGKGR